MAKIVQNANVAQPPILVSAVPLRTLFQSSNIGDHHIARTLRGRATAQLDFLMSSSTCLLSGGPPARYTAFGLSSLLLDGLVKLCDLSIGVLPDVRGFGSNLILRTLEFCFGVPNALLDVLDTKKGVNMAPTSTAG